MYTIRQVDKQTAWLHLGRVDSAAKRIQWTQHQEVYLTQSVFQVVLQNLIPIQICQLILYLSNSEGLVDGFVGVLTSGASRLRGQANPVDPAPRGRTAFPI